jgi:hypothetical protein
MENRTASVKTLVCSAACVFLNSVFKCDRLNSVSSVAQFVCVKRAQARLFGAKYDLAGLGVRWCACFVNLRKTVLVFPSPVRGDVGLFDKQILVRFEGGQMMGAPGSYRSRVFPYPNYEKKFLAILATCIRASRLMYVGLLARVSPLWSE